MESGHVLINRAYCLVQPTLLLFPLDVSLFIFLSSNGMTACFRDTLHPNSQQHTGKKPRHVQTQLYGYVLTPDWIKEFAARKKIGMRRHYLDTSSSVVSHILNEACLRRPYVVKWKGSVAVCIAVAHNKSAEGLKLATPERIEKLKRIMEVDEEPSWLIAV